MTALGIARPRLLNCILHASYFLPCLPILISSQTTHTSFLLTLPPPKSQRVLVIPEILLLIKQIRPTTPQINNLRTPIAVLLEPRALKAVKRIADALATAHDALVLVVAEGALVADARQCGRAHVGVAHGAFAVAFVAETADGYTALFAAHYEVAGSC